MPAYSPALREQPPKKVRVEEPCLIGVPRVVFIRRMRRSYEVKYLGRIPFDNDRGAHVETPVENLEGKTFLLDLASRKVKEMAEGKVAVMYRLKDLKAHITVYFGPKIGSEMF